MVVVNERAVSSTPPPFHSYLPMSVATLLDNTLRPPRQLVILQSSNAQSALPLLRSLIASDPARQTTILCCALHPPSALRVGSHLPDHVIAVDLTTYVPGYGGGIAALGEKVNKAVEEGEFLQICCHVMTLD
jgi:hypothetical protein